MSSAPDPAVFSPAELAERWSAVGMEWMQWWANAALGRQVHHAAATEPRDAPGGAESVPFDAEALEALNARYRVKMEALWSEATALLTPASSAALPPAGTGAHARADRRFKAREWSELPYFSLLRDSYLLIGDYLNELAQLARLPARDKGLLQYVTKQYVDALAPANFVATNPEVLKRALATNGASLIHGLANLAADARQGRITMSDERAFAVGRNLATTAGAVVFRNELIEVIQYAPTTARVHRRPLVIVPPCINKYYILDLQPEDSFVRWIVGEGHTVFLISWRNIPAELARTTWDDYIELGALKAIDVAREITQSKTVNALGFCVGGTLLACALAVLAARGERSVESATLLTTMLDFDDPGDIGFYISHERLAAREQALLAGQRVHGSELANAFASLRANELVWHYVINNYLKGETPPAFDLLHWNGDSANLPGPMYVYYLTNMYLDNKLRERGALTMAGRSIDLSRVTMPVYIYASRDDHIVPWRSAYKSVRLLGGNITFALGASGHIAGVVNPPAKHRRNYWTNALLTDDADDWFARAESHPGSWWPDWGAWLAPHGGPMRNAPSEQGTARFPAQYAAPGRYVLEAAN